MGRNFWHYVEKVREAADIVDVADKYLHINSNYKALCPFHEETNPSFSINPKDQFFYCFGCGIGGDVFKFVELIEEKTFVKALFTVANFVGVNIPSFTVEVRDQIQQKRLLEEILTYTARFYYVCLPSEAERYLKEERGLNEETISTFQIGYAKGGLRNHLINTCKFLEDDCINAGVLKRAESGAILDYFMNRIIIPNWKRGIVVSMTSRISSEGNPKYLNLPGEIQYLFNEDALASEDIVLTEGPIDCITAAQLGHPAVGVFGARNFKPEFAPKFSRCKRIYLCLDPDDAGESGTQRIGELLGDRIKVIQLPNGSDLNDYAKEHTKDDFDGLIATAENIIKHQIHLIPQDTDRTELPTKLDPVLRMISRESYAKSEAYLNYEIKPRFELTNKDIDGYRKVIKECQKSDPCASEVLGVDTFDEIIFTAKFDGLVDIVEHNDEIAFLVKDGNNLSILTEIQQGRILYRPPQKESIPWLLLNGDEVVGLWKELSQLSSSDINKLIYDDIVNYLKDVSELPGEAYYDLAACWSIHTYILENIQYSPIINFHGIPERGKSRTGKAMTYTSFRGIHVESLREAYILRIANNYQASIFFDVMNLWKKAERNGSEDIILHRFERGVQVPRVLYPEKGAYRDTVYFDVFGPTIIATNEPVHEILETRAINISMPEATRNFENDVLPEDSRELKTLLTAFRARYLGESLQELPKPVNGRLGDILKPFYQIIRFMRPERIEAFLELVRDIANQRLLEKSLSLEAEILKKIINLLDETEGGILPVKRITDEFNQYKSEKTRISYQRVGRRLSAMGFGKAKTRSGASAVLIDLEKIERMKQSFGLQETSETPETSVSSCIT